MPIQSAKALRGAIDRTRKTEARSLAAYLVDLRKKILTAYEAGNMSIRKKES
jgi:hypothetical protein